MNARPHRRAALTLLACALVGCSDPTSQANGLPPGTPPISSFFAPQQVVAQGFQSTSAGTTAIGARFTNAGLGTVSVSYGACGVAVWLYRTGARDEGPAWENALPGGGFCIAIAYSRSLAPGESFDVAGVTLGASTREPPPGTYDVRVAIRRRTSTSSQETLEVLDAGTIVVP